MSAFYENSYMNGDGPRRLFNDVTVLGADRKPCIVCGHETGDCTGDSGPPIVIFGQGLTHKQFLLKKTFLKRDK
jgi:hypothetical protein